MSFFTNIFRKRKPEDFESVLSALATDIQTRQTRLADIRRRERSATFLLTLYLFGFWVAYVAVWYASPGVLPRFTSGAAEGAVEKGVKAAPVVVGPVIVLFMRRIVQIFYQRIGNAEEKTLRVLHKQQRDKIEEFKKKTDYYKTRDLISRFDEGTTPAQSARGPLPSASANNTPSRGPGAMPVTPQRGPPMSQLQTPVKPGPGGFNPALMATPAQPLGPPRRQWFDKLADALLGDDESPSAGVSATRYALICQKCFAHNGLVKESMWEDAQYVCPKCGHFNPSQRSQRAHGPPSSISAPGSALPNSPPSAHPSSSLPSISSAGPMRGGNFAPPLDAPTSVKVEREDGEGMDVDS